MKIKTLLIKSIITEHPKASHKLFKTIRQAEKVSQVGFNGSLCSNTKKIIFLNEKNLKISKRVNAFKGYTSSYNNEILNSFNPELQIKHNESAINNKLKKTLTELRGFRFVATLILVLKNIESDDKTKYNTSLSKLKSRSNYQWKWHVCEMYLNQSILKLYLIYKNL